jgi:hypothetical protein
MLSNYKSITIEQGQNNGKQKSIKFILKLKHIMSKHGANKEKRKQYHRHRYYIFEQREKNKGTKNQKQFF